MADPHTEALAAELSWLGEVLAWRIERMSGLERARPVPPSLPEKSGLAQCHVRLAFGPMDRLVLILACAPLLRPETLDPLYLVNGAIGRRFTEFGGWAPNDQSPLAPTHQTAMFLIAGDNLGARLDAEAAMMAHAPAGRAGVQLRRAGETGDGPAVLQMEAANLADLTGGRPTAPAVTHGGATWWPLTTDYHLDELVVDASARAEVDHILAWARHEDTLHTTWALSRWIRRGHRALFHGPPGTGKTMTAALIGKTLGRPVMRIDVSRLISKYIGETEKNLSRAFDEASTGAVLFFDEADGLFGKRVEARSSNDRAANQEIGFLLQRIEDHPGLVLMATNLKGAIDPAFLRRIESLVYFSPPNATARRKLWATALQGRRFHLEADVDLDRLAEDHLLTGADILNVLRYVSICAADSVRPTVTGVDVVRAIRRELHKSGRPLAP